MRVSPSARRLGRAAVAGTWVDSLAPAFTLISASAVGAYLRVAGAAVVLLLVAWLLAGPRLLKPNGPSASTILVLCLALMIGTGGVVGLFRGNSLGYLTGDAARLGITLSAVWLARRVSEPTARHIVQRIWWALCVAEIVRLAVFTVQLLGGSFVRLGGGSAMALGMALAYRPIGPGIDPRLDRFGRVAIVVNALTSLVRSLWVVSLVMAGLMGVLALRRRYPGGIRRIVLGAGTVVVVLVVLTLAGANIGSRVAERVALSFGTSVDSSVESRDLEEESAMGTLDNLGLRRFGAGLGAQFPTPHGLEHQIHRTAVSLEFRHGSLGLAAWWWIIGCAVLAASRIILGRVSNNLDTVLLISCVGSVLSALSFYALIGNFPASFALGWAAAGRATAPSTSR